MEKHGLILQDPGEGGNQSGLRDRNARLVLSLIRRHGAIANAEIARQSGLSAQTVSNIVRSLEADGLLLREEAVKGKVGKPSVPMALNPNGVYALGLNIGRRSAELALVDFCGRLIDQRSVSYPYPVIEDVLDFLLRARNDILSTHPGTEALIAGIGVGLPFEIWSWLEVVDAPEPAMRAWQDIDLAARIGALTGYEAIIQNDATTACVAEHLVGRGSEFTNFAYIFIGAFIGGGLVLDGKVITGPTGNAAALGALLVPQPDGQVAQLLNVASLHVLERALVDAGIDPNKLRSRTENWEVYAHWVDPWIEQTARNLAIAAVSIASTVEIEVVLIDGAMPGQVRSKLVSRTALALEDYNPTGIHKPKVAPAKVGRNARSHGAALLPIHAKYFIA